MSDNDWKDIDTAPKDGGVIEIECTYGVRPWRGLYVWAGEPERDPDWPRVGYSLGWARRAGVHQSTITGRLRAGWPLERALTAGPQK